MVSVEARGCQEVIKDGKWGEKAELQIMQELKISGTMERLSVVARPPRSRDRSSTEAVWDQLFLFCTLYFYACLLVFQFKSLHPFSQFPRKM